MSDSKVALLPTTGERMKMALRYAGLSVQEIAGELEVNPVTASKWLTGKLNARGLVMRVWAERTGVNEEWLRTGNVPAGATILDECARRDSNSQPSDLSFFEALWLAGSRYSSASDAGWQILEAMLSDAECQLSVDTESTFPAVPV